jgi:hypothetical protein
MLQQTFAINKLKQHVSTVFLLFVMMCVLPQYSFAQDANRVTGKVTSSLGEVLSGVSVKEKGTSAGASTDAEVMVHSRAAT